MVVVLVLVFYRLQSPGEIKRREVSWTLTKKLDSAFAGPGEIRRREVSWTLTKKLGSFAGPGEIKTREVSWTHEEVKLFCRSRRDQEEGGELDSHEEIRLFAGPGEIKRREVVLNPQVNPRRDQEQAGQWSWAQKAGLLLLRLFFNSSATDIAFIL